MHHLPLSLLLNLAATSFGLFPELLAHADPELDVTCQLSAVGIELGMFLLVVYVLNSINRVLERWR